jgi:hypothetical protein
MKFASWLGALSRLLCDLSLVREMEKRSMSSLESVMFMGLCKEAVRIYPWGSLIKSLLFEIQAVTPRTGQ